MENGAKCASISPNILIFPLPMQGPVNSMLKLAELLILSSNNNLHVTFLTTNVVYHRLVDSACARERFDQNPRFSFHTFSDGLPDDHPRGGEKFLEMLDTVKVVSQQVVKEMVSTRSCTITSIVSDGLFDFALDAGNEAGLPVFYFETMSPCCLWVYFCLPKLVEAGEVPFTDNDLDALVDVPGMDGFMRRRDLPDFCRGRDEADYTMLQRVLGQTKQFRRAQGLILNTFEALDSHSLSNIRSHCPNLPIYTVGPLHLSLAEKLHAKATLFNRPFVSSYDHSNSFWHEDRSCIAWLDKQRSKSVIYCSFGSQVSITKEQLMEFWHGLVDSETMFLWVKRPGSIIGLEEDYEILKELELMHRELFEGISKSGCIVRWAPQVKILTHPAIGGFLTHGGWNSVIESVAAGVPMICWSHYVDQLVNGRLVSEIWKLGVDMKDTCNRATVNNMVRDIMHLRKGELLENATKLAKLALKSVLEGGSSYNSIDCLINSMISLTN